MPRGLRVRCPYTITGLTNNVSYDVQVRHVGTSDGTWSTTATGQPADFGSTAETAGTLDIDSPVHGVINSIGDVDVFRIDLSSNSTVWMYTTGDSDTVAELLTAEDDIIGGNDDGALPDSGFPFPHRLPHWMLAPTTSESVRILVVEGHIGDFAEGEGWLGWGRGRWPGKSGASSRPQRGPSPTHQRPLMPPRVMPTLPAAAPLRHKGPPSQKVVGHGDKEHYAGDFSPRTLNWLTPCIRAWALAHSAMAHLRLYMALASSVAIRRRHRTTSSPSPYRGRYRSSSGLFRGSLTGAYTLTPLCSRMVMSSLVAKPPSMR